jgi:hypothetical protein
LVLIATSCQPQRSLADRAPIAVPLQGTTRWQRTDTQAVAASELAAGTVSGTRLIYTGPPSMTVDLYQMSSSGSAFEAAQKWRTTPGKSVAYRGDLFLVFNYSQPDSAREFATAFLTALK